MLLSAPMGLFYCNRWVGVSLHRVSLGSRRPEISAGLRTPCIDMGSYLIVRWMRVEGGRAFVLSPYSFQSCFLPHHIMDAVNIRRSIMVSITDSKWFIRAWLFIGNPLVLLWQCYYVSAAVHPLRHTKRATDYTMSQFEFGVICALGGFLIFINGFASYHYFLLPLWRSWKEERFLRLDPIRISHGLRIAVFVVAMTLAGAVALLVTFAQFMSPFLTPELHWKGTYRHACDGMDIRAYLDTTESHPAEEIKFENIVSGERYTMLMDPNPWISPKDIPWVSTHDGTDINSYGYPNFGSGYSFSVIPTPGDFKREDSNFVPKWEYIRYTLGFSLNEMTFRVFGANESLINIGTLSFGENFTAPALMLHGDLGPFSKSCVFDPTVVMYSTNETSPGVMMKTPVMKTVQFKICDFLQVCADGGLAEMTPVPVGFLMIQRAKRGMGCCRAKRRIPGVEGRGRN